MIPFDCSEEGISSLPSPPSPPSPEMEAARQRWQQKMDEKIKRELLLITNIKSQLPELEKLLSEIEGHWGIEDDFYRLYHQSWKVYGVQKMTADVVKVLQELLPDQPLNTWFMDIVKEGTGKTFEMSHNSDWLKNTRPMIEAFFHSHYFLKMACKYGRELESPPQPMPSGWAAVLYLYGMR